MNHSSYTRKIGRNRRSQACTAQGPSFLRAGLTIVHAILDVHPTGRRPSILRGDKQSWMPKQSWLEHNFASKIRWKWWRNLNVAAKENNNMQYYQKMFSSRDKTFRRSSITHRRSVPTPSNNGRFASWYWRGRFIWSQSCMRHIIIDQRTRRECFAGQEEETQQIRAEERSVKEGQGGEDWRSQGR